MSPEAISTTPRSIRRPVVAWFWVIQVIAFGVGIGVIANEIGRPEPWPTVVTFGVVLAQCALAAAFTVFGLLRLAVRITCSATVVVAGGLAIVMTDAPRWRLEDTLLVSLFALLMWGMIQSPLWLCRLFLRARTVIGTSAVNAVSRPQYGIRQLMVLTFTVAMVLGLGRVLLPPQMIEELKTIRAVDWLFFVSLAVAAGLIVSTTIMTTLNPYYWRAGLGVSAASSGLIAYGLYSVMTLLGPSGPSKERFLFAVMILCTYAWLQFSLLLVRAAGYRIVVGT